MADLNTQVPVPNSMMVNPETGYPIKAWFDFFTTLFLRTGGPTANASNLLDTLGLQRGGMLSRFAAGWSEFVATVPNTVPIMNPGSIDVQLFTISQLLDLLGTARGDILYRGAASWQVLAPVANGFLKSNGAGADPSYSVASAVPATVATGLTATGTIQGDALVLAAEWNLVSTTGANTGVLLPDFGAGIASVVYNDGANALKVYPPVGGQINALGVNNPYSLPAAKNQIIRQVTAVLWRTTELG